MTKTVHLDPNQVPAALRGSYSGRKFKAVVTESVYIPATAGLWDGGSRDTFHAAELETGRTVAFPGQNEAPWGNRQAHTVTLVPGIVVIEHSVFCGKDSGLTFYVHPDNATKLLPAPAAELSDFEKIVLKATRSYKSSYMGRDRYQMALADRPRPSIGPFPTRQDWETAKQSLMAKGLLNKAGAITTAGKNAAA